MYIVHGTILHITNSHSEPHNLCIPAGIMGNITNNEKFLQGPFMHTIRTKETCQTAMTTISFLSINIFIPLCIHYSCVCPSGRVGSVSNVSVLHNSSLLTKKVLNFCR